MRTATLPKHFTPPHVRTLTAPPVVDRWYMVDAIRWWDTRFVPVRGPAHADAGLHDPHWHVDMRFASRHIRRALSGPLPHICSGRGGAVLLVESVGKPEPRPMQCVTTDTFGNCVHSRAPLGMVAIERRGRLYCPHRGADLTDVPAVDGFVRCPLHGAVVKVPA